MDKIVFMEEIDDIGLVKKALKGDVNSFRLLIDKYQTVILNLAFRMTGNTDDAKDITQVVFVKIYNNLASYDSRFKFYSWMYRIALNEIINFNKSKKTTDSLNSYMKDESDPEADLTSLERIANIHKAVSELKPDYRELIELKYFEELSYNDISDVLGLNEKKVKSRLFTAREQLKHLLIKYEVI